MNDPEQKDKLIAEKAKIEEMCIRILIENFQIKFVNKYYK